MSAALQSSELEQTIRAHLQTLGSLAATIAKNPRATVPLSKRTPSADAPPHSGKTALAALKKIQRDPNALHIRERLGEGGMGVVHVGHQIALDRRVAVKTLRTEHMSDDNVESLLGEAWLAGSLEHPNIVPIYDLGLDTSGAPQLVMKRIEGDTWSDLLGDSDIANRHSVDRDPLEFHLRVLIQVCNAVHFAHSRDVIHRDLKPDNVMIGDFGEVYVLDWGVATRPGPIKHIAGTLVYMAPEMLGGGCDITARTDVYLLGALLYEILASKPPHQGENMQAMLASIVLSAPCIPDAAPPELAALASRCMRRDPEERFESALAVRRAIELFLEHRGATVLAEQAQTKLAELEAILAAEKPEVERAYNVFGECRFGFRQALRAWKDSDMAQLGMRRAVTAMVKFEAAQGDARAAALLLSELDERDPVLEALVEEARHRAELEAKSIEKLRKLEKDLDPREGRRTRMLGAVGFGAMWTLVPFIAPYWAARYPGYETLLSVPFSIVSILAMAIGYFVFKIRSRITKQLISAFAFGLAAQPVCLLGLVWCVHLDPSKTVLVLMGYWFIVMGLIAASLERRLAPLPIAYIGGFFIALKFPDYRYDAVAGVNFVSALTAGIVWSRRATERAIEREKIREERGTMC